MKKLVTLVAALALVLTLAGCNSGPKKLVVWTFTDELQGMIEDYYLVDYPDLGYEIEVIVTPNETYQDTIDPVLATGVNAPDVFAMEAAFVRKYVESDYLMDIADLPLTLTTANTLQYTLDVATNDAGNVKALSWQGTPGVFFYRHDLAETYLGATTPAEMQALVDDWDAFLDAARAVNTASSGATKLVASPGELSNVFYANKAQSWVVNDELVVDPGILEYLDLSKTLISEGLTNEAGQWSEAWFAGMSTDDTMGYFLPTWGLHYVISPNSATFNDDGSIDEAQPSTYGNWTMIQGPGAYFWGGTWLGAREGTKMTDEAAHLIEYLTLNEDFLTRYAQASGDFVSNENVIADIKDGFSHEFLNGQNHYEVFAELAMNIDASKLSGYDLTINNHLADQMALYSNGEKTLEEALTDFKAAVATSFPDITVE